MIRHRMGNHTIEFAHGPRIVASAAVVGPKEGRGPWKDHFDLVLDDALFGQQSYEQAERAIFQEACERCLKKAEVQKEQEEAED